MLNFRKFGMGRSAFVHVLPGPGHSGEFSRRVRGASDGCCSPQGRFGASRKRSAAGCERANVQNLVLVHKGTVVYRKDEAVSLWSGILNNAVLGLLNHAHSHQHRTRRHDVGLCRDRSHGRGTDYCVSRVLCRAEQVCANAHVGVEPITTTVA